jgi:Rps23 Pro-64 3,4-dihydroxylase Tpa1-like proline 4-hydroxylase
MAFDSVRFAVQFLFEHPPGQFMESSSGLSIIDPSVLERAEHYQRDFQSSPPFPHVVIENFLTPEFASELLDSFPTFERGNYIGDDGKAGGKSILAKIRQVGPAYARLDDAIKSPEFLKALSTITGIPDLIYDPWYLGGGTHESRNGVSLDTHVDFNYHPSERWHRRLNLIVYLNPIWKDEWGGCLEIFRDPHADNRPSQLFGPAFNRCVIFETSERSWHGFDQIRLPPEHADLTRRSIALYFYTKDRPAEETAGRHTTYYVKRQLPDRYIEGYTLSRSDLAEIKHLLETRDGHITMLYAENTAMREAEDRGLTGRLLYLLKKAYVRYWK